MPAMEFDVEKATREIYDMLLARQENSMSLAEARAYKIAADELKRLSELTARHNSNSQMAANK